MTAICEKIRASHPDVEFERIDTARIYVADFTERTKGTGKRRAVEVNGTPPGAPSGGLMDCAVFHNAGRETVEFAMFDDSKFIDISGENVRHCECSMHIGKPTEPRWVAFLEIKDCQPSNILRHRDKAIEQIANVARDFRARGIVSHEHLIGIVSCPRQKTAFNSTIVGTPVDALDLKRRTGITFFGTNDVLILGTPGLKPILLTRQWH